ncbi:PRP39 pre-mRNA processing factor 39 isoform 1-like protein [Camelus ferus]|nr:PRP39 pre-mRNA processing factor 39 isoform 1-like protein [Camelus ferus]
MNVTEMEQSPDGSPNVNTTTEENETANTVDLPVTETEANFPPEYEKFWKTVESNPQDFTGWVYLLQYVEQENHLMAARKAFDKFFIHYPYCYGYWKKYADLEKRHDNIKQSDEVRTLLNKVISIRFKEHVQNNLPRDLLTGEQFIQLRRELASVNGHSGDDGPPGDDLPSGIEDITDPAKIKRPYFHVKPLEKAQLKNWKEYLEFEIENGTHERVVVLFERCVISCALYEEFWIKYAKYMENHSIEGVRHVFSRACTIHLPKKPMVHMLWAAFEEQQGNINEARNILRTFEECVLGLAMVRLRRVSLERRHGNMEEAECLLQDAIKNAKSNNESSFYAIKLARHLFKIQKNFPKSRNVLLEAIERDKENTKLYLNLLEMEYSGDLKQNEENILNCFDKAIHGSLPIKMRITFSQRKVEFLEDFGSDVNKLLNAYDEHQTLLKEQDSLKRKAENGSEEPEEKKAHTEDTTSSSTQMIDGDLQANQAAYNYSAWYQFREDDFYLTGLEKLYMREREL